MKTRHALMVLSFGVTLLAGGASHAQTPKTLSPVRLPAGASPETVRANLPPGLAGSRTLKIVDILGTPSYQRQFDGSGLKTTLYLKPQTKQSSRNGFNATHGASQPAQEEAGLHCTSSTVSVSLGDDSFKSVATSANATKLYPGAVYSFDSFFSGRLNPESAARNPVVVSVGNVALRSRGGADVTLKQTGEGYSYVTVPDPKPYTLSDAATLLQSRISGAGGVASFAADIYQVSSGADTQLKVAGSAAAWGASVDTAFSSQRSSQEHHFVVDATQEMYTLTANMTEGGVFVNPADAQKDNKLMMSTVTYGHRVLLSIKTTFDSARDAQAVAAAYSNGMYSAKVSLDAVQQHFGSQTQIKVFTVGGGTPSFETLNVADAKKWLEDYFRRTTVSNAKPIKYQFSNMNNDLVRSESATTNVPVRNCIPENVTLKVTLEKITNKKLDNQSGTTGDSSSTRDELVKLGTRQEVYVMQGGSRINDYRGGPKHNICWWGTDEVPPNCRAAREFNGSIPVNDTREFKLKFSQIGDGDQVKIWTDYIAMYRTRTGGSTNSARNADTDTVYVRDVAKSSGGISRVVEVPFNGRVFQYHYKFILQ